MSQNTDQFTILNPSLIENGRTLVLTLNHGKANEWSNTLMHGVKSQKHFTREIVQ